MGKTSFRKKLVATTALAIALVNSYGRRSYAGCYSTGYPNYLCSGSSFSPIVINANNATAITDATFSVATQRNAITITGDGNIRYIDNYGQNITAYDYNGQYSYNGITITSNGDDGATAGSIVVATRGQLKSYSRSGIVARNFGSGDTIVQSSSDIIANSAAIDVLHYGAYLNVGAFGNITAGNGIIARNNGHSGTYLDVSATITAEGDGIVASSGATTNGALRAYIRGDLASYSGTGMTLDHAGQGDIRIGIYGDIYSSYQGLMATHTGTGDIYLNMIGSSHIFSRSNALYYAHEGIKVEHTGYGSIDLHIAGDVEGSVGIAATTGADTANLNISLTSGAYGGITGTYGAGIDAYHNGSGDLTIDITGTVQASGSHGIFAKMGDYAGGDVLIDVNALSNVTSDTKAGINVNNRGSGGIGINISGHVEGVANGISTYSSSNSLGNTDIVIENGGEVETSSGAAIYIKNYATDGDVSVTLNGAAHVSGTAYGTKGIEIINSADSGDVSVTLSDPDSYVYSQYERAILVRNYGDGDVYMNLAGKVTGDKAVTAYAWHASSRLEIVTGADSVITGSSREAINASSYLGSLSLTINGVAEGGRDGVVASAYSDMSIVTGEYSSVTGTTSNGISAINIGNGNIAMNIAGDVTGFRNGIYARTSYDGANITVDVAETSHITAAYGYGIYLLNQGHGTIDANVNGDIESYYNGIKVRNSGGDVSITTGSESNIKSAQRPAVSVKNTGTGNVLLNLDGVLEASNNYTVIAQNYNGSMSINIAGTVNSTYGQGISAINNTGTTDLIFSSVAGSEINAPVQTGVNLFNWGTGDTAISIGGDITADNAVMASSSSYSGGLSFYSGSDSIISAKRGVYLSNDGQGETSASVFGDIITSYGAVSLQHRGNTSEDLLFETAASSLIKSASGIGVSFTNFSRGATILNIDGHIEAYYDAIEIYNSSAAYTSGMAITTGSGSVITSSHGKGVTLRNSRETSPFSFEHRGILSGVTGLKIDNDGNSSAGILTDGIIEGTGGIAIEFSGGYGVSHSTRPTPINIAGGRIIGDVVDHYGSSNLSPVTISGDFTSEGSFEVSSFNVGYGAEFILGANNAIETARGVTIGGDFTVASAGGSVIGDLEVQDGGALSVDEDFDIDGVLINEGTLSIATGKKLSMRQMSAGSGDLVFGVYSAANHALLEISNGAANLTGQAITIDVGGVDNLHNNDRFILIDGSAQAIGGPGGTMTAVNSLSVLWNFSIVDGTFNNLSDNTDIWLSVRQASSTTDLSVTPNNANAAAVVMGLQGTADPQLSQIVANMNAASTVEDFNDVVEAVQATADMGDAMTMTGFTDRMMSITDMRLETLRDINTVDGKFAKGLAETEIAAPQGGAWAMSFGENSGSYGEDRMSGDALWQSLSGRYARQGARDGIDGYRAVSGGMAAGFDSGASMSGMTLGVAFGYAHADVTSFNANRAENNVDGYQLLLYGTKALAADGFVDVMVSYGLNNNDTKRHDVGGVVGLTAKGDFISQQAGFRTKLGRQISHADYLVTPAFSFDWLHYMADDYTERGAGGANLSVDTKNYDSVEMGAEIKIAKPSKMPSGAIVVPEMHLGYAYDFIGDNLEKTAQFTGGGAAFETTSPDGARHRGNMGLGVTYQTNDHWDYSLTYDLDVSQAYTAHTALAKANWNF